MNVKYFKPYAFATRLMKPHGNLGFIKNYIAPNGKVLDVGCGSNCPCKAKILRPDIHYVGLDIVDHSQSLAGKYADELIATAPEKFNEPIEQWPNRFDAVISSHNLEHCNDYKNTLLSMFQSISGGGKLYISFPCEDSIHFPRRKGTLNFYDDPTHNNVIPFESVVNLIENNGFKIIYKRKKYKPFLGWLLGLLMEPFSRLSKKVLPGTWVFWGFESIIIAKKI
jgi:SAM-dependent methyltransferase